MSFGTLSPPERPVRDILVRIASSVGRSATAALDERRCLTRARRLMHLGEGLRAFHRGTPTRDQVAIGLYRRALRVLAADVVEAGADAATVHRALRARLRQRGVPAWLRRRATRGRGRTIAVALALLGLTLAGTPGARRALFPLDLADGRPWLASSAWGDFPRAGVMTDATRVEGLFHTNEEPSPSVTIDLGAVHAIHQVEVENRGDCCRDRPQPLALELSGDGANWRRVGYRRAAFRTWTAPVAAEPARYVRLRVDRTSVLHLRRVRVF